MSAPVDPRLPTLLCLTTGGPPPLNTPTKKPITATKKKKITKKKKEVCTGTDGMTKMTKKTPTKMMKIADTGMDIGTDTETDSVKTTPVKNLKNLRIIAQTSRGLSKIKLKMMKMKKAKVRRP